MESRREMPRVKIEEISGQLLAQADSTAPPDLAKRENLRARAPSFISVQREWVGVGKIQQSHSFY